MAVQGAHARRRRKAGGQGRGAELGCARARAQDVAYTDVFDEVGVDAGSLDQGLQGAVQQVRGVCVFETTLAAFCESCAQRAGHYDVVGSLLEDEVAVGWEIVFSVFEVRRDLVEAVLGWDLC